jgi:hypothetical protein
MAKKTEKSQALQVSGAAPPPAPISPVEPGSRLTAATGSNHQFAQDHLILGVLAATRSSKEPEEFNHKIAVAVALLEGIKPEGELEGMLAAQMVATHMAAMDCLASAVGVQTPQAKDIYLRHAEKLLATYTRQLEALDKHRGKGQQNVTVGHLHVQQGGQSLVGNVQINPGAPTPDTGLDIDHNSIEASENADTVSRKRSPHPSPPNGR